eukprot:TRINITY_DN35525_c0_g1_i1.p1 TRINITY_DN35525_c0_g1~~TRINITY_DN35525_c0_g1_i1.p1  ORF type:complete len:216 (+),score=51.28 TRINITY_DN35525_c0_g1_i1:92-739(+)
MQKYKVVFLGDTAAGKTSLVRRYMYGNFEEDTQATIGMDFQSKTVHLDDSSVRLQLWDTAGQERFRSLIPSYLRDAAAAVLVYDVTKRASFEGIFSTTEDKESWRDILKSQGGDSIIMALVANKTDLVDERQVTTEEAQAKATELGMLFMETSARTGDNVESLFKEVAGKVSAGAGAPRGGEAGEKPAAGPPGAGAQSIQLDGKQSKGDKKKCNC